jgi:hypothetical protein
MGCNCGKKRTGSLTPAQRQAAALAAQQKSGTTTSGGGVPKTNPAKTTYSLKLNDGKVQTFDTKLEADAANVRSGYRGRVQ